MRPVQTGYASRTDRLCVPYRLILFTIACILIFATFPVYARNWPPDNFYSPNRTSSDVQYLSIAKDANTEDYGPGAARFDFGKASFLESGRTNHVFTVKNTGKTALVLDHLQTSCGCTTAVLGGSSPEHFPFTLAANQQVSVRVSVDLTSLSPGWINKEVWMFARGQAEPAAILKVTGTLLPSVTFSPTAIDFGKVVAGSTHSVALTITVDPRLLGAGITPQIVCSSPGVQIIEIVRPLGNNASRLDLGSDKQPKNVYRYLVTLAPEKRLGVIDGVISVVPKPMSADPEAVANALVKGSVALGGASIPLDGEVTGDVSADPGMIAFGFVPFGKRVTQQIALIASPTTQLKLLVSCTNPHLTVRLIDSKDKSVNSPHRPNILEATLNPDTPCGVITTQIGITTVSGQQLVLPVSALVSR